MKKINQNGLSTVFHYGPDGELLWEKDQAGNTKAYVWLDGRPLARIDNDAQIYYYHVDRLGTPQAMTNSAGTVVWTAVYEPFGKATVTTSTVENNLRLPGQYYDRETRLHYNYFRDYEPTDGRYIEFDLIGLRGGLNGYAYTLGNPLRYTDPLGLEVTMTCRPLSAAAWLPAVHCGDFVWHWVTDKCGRKHKVIDSQFSLPGFGTSPTSDPTNGTYVDDRNAFNNPGGANRNYLISPPPGMTQQQFDQAVQNSGNSYSAPFYDATGTAGPNSNSAANQIIEGAGGNTPNVPGAIGQYYWDIYY